MTLQNNSPSIERKIHFFRADAGIDESGKSVLFDPCPALSVIGTLPFTNDDSGRYESESDGNVLCILVDSNGAQPSMRLCRVRRTALPQMERAGQVNDLNLADDTGLLEATHVMFFPNGIVGAEYNHFGPRLSRLGNYLHVKSSKAVTRATFRPLLRGDSTQQIDRLRDLRVLEMNILPAYVDTVANADQSLADAFQANRRILENPRSLQVILKPQRDAATGFLAKMVSPLQRFLGNDDLREGTERLQVRGLCTDTNKVETIDLLNDHLISVKSIVRLNGRTRALDSTSAFQAIDEAYQQLRPELERAAGVSP